MSLLAATKATCKGEVGRWRNKIASYLFFIGCPWASSRWTPGRYQATGLGLAGQNLRQLPASRNDPGSSEVERILSILHAKRQVEQRYLLVRTGEGIPQGTVSGPPWNRRPRDRASIQGNRPTAIRDVLRAPKRRERPGISREVRRDCGTALKNHGARQELTVLGEKRRSATNWYHGEVHSRGARAGDRVHPESLATHTAWRVASL